MGVLREMGVADKPRMVMWNKLDLLPEEEQVCPPPLAPPLPLLVGPRELSRSGQ